MANAFLGEATARVDGKVYTLRLDFNAMCDFEERTGRDAIGVLADFEFGGKTRISDLRALVHAMLLRHHPDATLALAGDILSQDSTALMEAVKAATPKVPEGPAGN
jgi:hypothetical protein